VYNVAGTYTVKLTVRNSTGGTGTGYSPPITITQPPTPIPNPKFTLSPTAGVAPQTVVFDGSASRDAAGGTIAAGKFSWIVYNSLNSQVSPALPGNAIVSWRIPTAGTYRVALTVTAANGATASISHNITLGSLLPPTGIRTSNAVGHLFGSTRVTVTWTGAAHSPGDTIKYNILISNSGSGCGFGLLDLNNSSGSYVNGTSANPPIHSYTWSIPGSFGSFLRNAACSGHTYQVQMQTIRIDSDGATWVSALSPPTNFNFAFAL
jgi:PKD repeat protein